ncbi:LptF/LptG family permease [Confluentibacter flavum]|uniref:YjgP/YjgQ family permease n=1 Tax=Confluentibacter flavum TaxID=1909700 RepID=A0A2N3HL04_9FLAO|nr:LptF/LptG family permease [Confluentibacter flavum]PKQ45554.1 YjgP/YjgQ family permease [Confluentibacter flavum]
MKILDRYILTTYLKTFISVFSILILIFALQTIWLYIRELAGKDLDIWVIFKFLFYFLPKLIPLVLPLTILLASIMVFGSFAENYEFAAMKSTGISLQRAMSRLSVFIVILGFTTFLFANNVIPWAEYNSFNLRTNIAKLKPAMAIAKGQFNEVGSYNIKVEDKSGDNDRYLKNVTIHIKDAAGRRIAETIKSKTGELISDEKSSVLKLVLKDGNYYNDLLPKDVTERQKKPFAKSTFKIYTINIDLSQMHNVDLDDKSLTDKYNMLNISGLDYTLDSLTNKHEDEQQLFSKSLYLRSNIDKNAAAITKRNQLKDSITVKSDSIFTGNILDLFTTNKKVQFVRTSVSTLNSDQQFIEVKKTNIKTDTIIYNRHIISLHEKLALGFACIILFFVGAPLGALIRKGGMGLPMIVAILIFLTYHFIGIFATNSAKSGGLNPIIAPWVSTLIMLPLGIYFTKRATEDRGLFEMDHIIDPIKKMFNIKDDDSVDYKFLYSLKDDKLIDVINNYNTLGHQEGIRFEAINLLNQRGHKTKDLSDKIKFNADFPKSQTLFKDFNDHSKFSIVLYSIGVILLVLFFVFRNNKLPSLASFSIQFSLISLVLFVVYYLKSVLNLWQFYKHINKKIKIPHIILLIIGLPLYMMTHPFLKSKIREDLKQNCLDFLK